MNINLDDALTKILENARSYTPEPRVETPEEFEKLPIGSIVAGIQVGDHSRKLLVQIEHLHVG